MNGSLEVSFRLNEPAASGTRNLFICDPITWRCRLPRPKSQPKGNSEDETTVVITHYFSGLHFLGFIDTHTHTHKYKHKQRTTWYNIIQSKWKFNSWQRKFHRTGVTSSLEFEGVEWKRSPIALEKLVFYSI